MRDVISGLKDIRNSKSPLENIRAILYEFTDYKIKDDYIYGTKLKNKLEYESLFKTKNKADIIFYVFNIGKLVYEEDEIQKYYKEDYSYNGKICKKPRIEVEIETLNDKAIRKILEFINKYGLINGEKYNLKLFLRKAIEFYCTMKILEKIDKDNINSIDKDMLLVLYPQYRVLNKKELSKGVATNIQENGDLKFEKKTNIFNFFNYNELINDFEMFNVCNDYVALAYYQLAYYIIMRKDSMIIFPRCIICGDYILEYKRSDKKICDKEECKKIYQRERTRKCRERKNERRNNK